MPSNQTENKEAVYGCTYDHTAHTWICTKGVTTDANAVVKVHCSSCPRFIQFLEVCAKMKTWNINLK